MLIERKGGEKRPTRDVIPAKAGTDPGMVVRLGSSNSAGSNLTSGC